MCCFLEIQRGFFSVLGEKESRENGHNNLMPFGASFLQSFFFFFAFLLKDYCFLEIYGVF